MFDYMLVHFVSSFCYFVIMANPFPWNLSMSFPSENHEILRRRHRFEVSLDAAYGSAPGSAGMRPRAPYAPRRQHIDDDDDGTQRETHRRRVGGPNRPRPRRKSFSWRSLALASAVPRHCLTYGEHNAAHRGPERKRRSSEEREETGCRGVLRFRRRQRSDKRFAPCLTTFRFSFHGLYTSEALVKPSRPAVSLAPSLFSTGGSRWHTRLAVFTACRFLSLALFLSQGRNPRENLPAPLYSPIHRSSFFLDWSWLREIWRRARWTVTPSTSPLEKINPEIFKHIGSCLCS